MNLFEKIKSYLAVPAKAVGQTVQRDAEASLEFPEQSIIGLTKASQTVQKGIEDASVYGINKGKEYGLADPFVETLGALPSIASRMALPQTEEETGAMLATPIVNPLAKFMVTEGTIAGKGMYQGGKALVDKITGHLPPPPSAMEPALAEGVSAQLPSATLMPAENTNISFAKEAPTPKNHVPYSKGPTERDIQLDTRLAEVKAELPTAAPVPMNEWTKTNYAGRTIYTNKEGYAVEVPKGIDPETFIKSIREIELKESGTSAIGAVPKEISKPYAKPFYSYLEQTVNEKMPARMSGKDLQGLLTNAQVKREELQYSGMDELFEKPVVTKQEVLDHLQANKIELKEITMGGKAELAPIDTMTLDELQVAYEREFDQSSEGLSKATLQAELGALGAGYSAPEASTKFEAYQLPGGKNYKEMLFQLPQKDTYIKQQGTDDFAIYRYNENTPIREGLHENEVQQVLAEVDPQRYQSSHFDEPNILAHTRFNEVKDANGKKVLRIEEIQSDWHQEGRDAGYKGNIKTRLEDLNKRAQELAHKSELTPAEEREFRTTEQLIFEYKSPSYQAPGVPDAPFKKNWHEMVMRRMIRYAAENGFDKVAWTTGAQQAKRYNLSKQIEHIEWADLQDGMRHIELKPKGTDKNIIVRTDATGKVIDGPGVNATWIGKDLKQVIGKGIAEKIMKDRYGKLAGKGLDIGGEGMKGFYDEMLPSYVNKFTKKWGGQVVDEKFGGKGKALSTADKQAIRQTLREVANGNLSREEANDELDGLYELSEDVYDNLESTGRDRASRSNETSSYITSIVNNISKANNEKAKYTLHTLSITPEMKRAALTKGFPLFSGAAILNYLNDVKNEKKKGVQ